MNKQPARQSKNEIGVRRSLFDEKARREVEGMVEEDGMHGGFRLVRAFGLCGELELMFRARVLAQRSGRMCGPRTLFRRSSPLAPIDARSDTRAVSGKYGTYGAGVTSMAGSAVTAKLRGRDATAGKRLFEMTGHGNARSALPSACAGCTVRGQSPRVRRETHVEKCYQAESHFVPREKHVIKVRKPGLDLWLRTATWSPEGRGTTTLSVYSTFRRQSVPQIWHHSGDRRME